MGRWRMHKAVSLFTLVAAIIAATWWWLGRAVPMPASPLESGEKLYCVSYAPFRGQQTPLDLSTRIEPRQIEEDLVRLAQQTECIRIYSVDFGLDQVPEIAGRHGLKVLLGLWVSSHADRTKYQIETGISLAKRFPGVIRGVIVGNEALLRGEVAPETLANLIRVVKAQVTMPVSYADVWEFWLRYRELVGVVDFITVHILPYWEDHPIAADRAADHVDSIRKQVAGAFGGKEVLIGEVGWPSAGRMRAGALPSPANQARVIHDTLTRGKRENFRVNIIEAFDQPWKRYLEGTVGGHWGLLSDSPRTNKFEWGTPVSNHPHWRWQALGGIFFAGLVFGAAFVARRVKPGVQHLIPGQWIAIIVIGSVSGVLSGWTIENIPIESLGFGGWLRSLALAAVTLIAPPAAAAAIAANVAVPSFANLIGPAEDRVRGGLQCAHGWLLLALCVLAIATALPLAFDPRYRDFPFAPLTCATVPFLLAAWLLPRPNGARSVAETTASVVLLAAAAAIVFNEGWSNWQALWYCAALAALALTLARVGHAPG
jgi:exo-beta-1,3-glucanase (GH17 family)